VGGDTPRLATQYNKYYIAVYHAEDNMTYREIFFKMLDEMGISARQLAKQANVKPCQISLFRNEKSNIKVETFFNLVEAAESLRPGAKKYFAMQYSEGFNTSNLVESLSNDQLGDLLIKAASRVKSMSPGKNQDEERAQSELSYV
jgi:transcriptional regulator with XRE-family HTH domain